MVGGTTWTEKANKIKDESLMVKIPQTEYKQLLDLETRVDVAVERMTNDEYCDIEDVLRILGTELALQKADEIREEEKRRHEEYMKTTGRTEETGKKTGIEQDVKCRI